MKFVPQLILAPSDRTYADVIQDVANGVYDMMVADVEITAERRAIVSFSSAIFDNSIRIVMRQTPSAGIDLLSFLKPFTNNLWLVLFGTIIYAGILICLLERDTNDALRNRSISSLFFMSVWYGIGVIVGYGVDFHVRTAAGRLLTSGLYIVSIVFVATYTANLASYLTISKSGPPVTGLDDIKNGKLTFNRIGIRIGTEMEDFYLREISGGNRNFYPLKSYQQQYTSLLNGVIDATFMDSGTAEYITNNIYCNLTTIGASFDQNSFGIVMPKQWLYIQDVDVSILSLREVGILDSLRTKWFLNQICPNVDDTPAAMDIGSLAGLFLTFAIICILSVLLFMWRTRHTIADYLLDIAHRKQFLTHIRRSMITRTPKSS
jgi:ABC-type amino acid transport substrate-binding protein